jgi:crotonobetainyl-CoA:carnitine CoA-transferase CaiB-like acyl-CoA transferase
LGVEDIALCGIAPLLGQHTGEVLGELGLSREEIDRLATAGVIELSQDA